jgi:hypothetical protein
MLDLVTVRAQIVLIHPRERQGVFNNNNACLIWHFVVRIPI